MRELQYLSIAKLDDFYEPPRKGLTDRAVDAEASVLGASARVALGEGVAAEPTPAERLESVLDHLNKECWARTWEPAACAHLGRDAWLEFRSPFRYGAAVSDVGYDDRGVFAYASLEERHCPHRDGEFCPNIELLLCGSKQHVRDHRDHPPTRMGSGSDWLHHMAAELVRREADGDTTPLEALASANLRDQEFAARSAFSMISHFYRTPGYLRGHARVLCNFPPERLRHRMIVATPLYVEAGVQPVPSTRQTGAPERRRRWWRPPGLRSTSYESDTA
ncbi:SAVMC3_10250 family protein [Streptomyces phaeochromogenes]|uniref:SAVMC3_10250 family protein n=1 Tax=Streptomyces phaeochromogenes TaxID=1923 RepID=UPI00099EC18A|nr:SAVMC3_10250 family protein [Streptomyces phaeochromogenes]